MVVVDDGRDDATRDLVRQLAARRLSEHQPLLRYLRPARGRGPAQARNIGWGSTMAPLVAFTDDDTVPAPDWLAEGLAAQAHPQWVAAAGQVVVPLLHDRAPNDHERMTQGLEAAEFVTANAFVRRGALESVGGFDERFTAAWREGSDLPVRRLLALGPWAAAPSACCTRAARELGRVPAAAQHLLRCAAVPQAPAPLPPAHPADAAVGPLRHRCPRARRGGLRRGGGRRWRPAWRRHSPRSSCCCSPGGGCAAPTIRPPTWPRCWPLRR
ncbi:MAG: glycosyltransferase [Rubrivivax sp.]